MKIKKIRIAIYLIILTIIIGLFIPQNINMPVEKADKNSFNPGSFWYYPWGKSGTHKGVDIFAEEGTAVKSSTGGLVIYSGQLALGGNVVIILGPKWRLHYYAHLKEISTKIMSWTSSNQKIGSVGTTGNAVGKPPHLHYSITSLIPMPWLIDSSEQGWKKMFYINPIPLINKSFKR